MEFSYLFKFRIKRKSGEKPSRAAIKSDILATDHARLKKSVHIIKTTPFLVCTLVCIMWASAGQRSHNQNSF